MRGIGSPQFLPHWLLIGILIFFPLDVLGETGIEEQSCPVVESESLPPESRGAPVELTADRIEYDRDRDEFHATGSVDVTRGPIRLTADEAVLQKLTGQLRASGNVHLREEQADIWAEQLELNLNTEGGVVTNGNIFWKEHNSFITGKRIQRFSEIHYRIKEGSFTNCDAKDGQIPAWRFTFDDIDLDFEDSIFGKAVWFNVNDVPVIPLPTFRYPLGANRKSGFLFPTSGYDTAFGFRYRQGFFWAIDASQDLTVTPNILSERGGGADVEYRYIWSRQARGQWLISGLRDTVVDQTRAQFIGGHVQQFSPDVSLKANINYSTDRAFLQELSYSGAQRGLPSQESNILLRQRLDHGVLYFLGQFMQPLTQGGDDTFQRMPEVGHRMMIPNVFGTPFELTAETSTAAFVREEGFNVGRLDFMPGLSMEGLHWGNVLGFRPQVKFREVAYSRGATDQSFQHRETFWAGAEAFTHVSRRFTIGENHWIRHTISPHVIYEFVPPTKQHEFVMIDAVDDLLPKSLVTYSLRNRISQQGGTGDGNTWLDLFIAQSYHVGQPTPLASKFSNIWTRGHFHKPVASQELISAFNVLVDAFVDPKTQQFSQMNTDTFIQGKQAWYLSVGQRFARAGPIVRRGDIWNPISFNEVLVPSDEIVFLTAGGGVRLPYGVTVGTKWYHDLRTGQTAEWDLVGLYQNPCRCFSLGFYFTQFPDRTQFDFLISLSGLWGTSGFGTQMMKSILFPLMADERGVPWDYR